MAQNRYVFAQRDVDDYSCIKIVEGAREAGDFVYHYLYNSRRFVLDRDCIDDGGDS